MVSPGASAVATHRPLSQSWPAMHGSPSAPGLGLSYAQTPDRHAISAGQSAAPAHGGAQYPIDGASSGNLHSPLAQLSS